MASLKPRGVAGGGWLAGGWDWPQYSYLSPAQLGLGLSLAKIRPNLQYDYAFHHQSKLEKPYGIGW